MIKKSEGEIDSPASTAYLQITEEEAMDAHTALLNGTLEDKDIKIISDILSYAVVNLMKPRKND